MATIIVGPVLAGGGGYHYSTWSGGREHHGVIYPTVGQARYDRNATIRGLNMAARECQAIDCATVEEYEAAIAEQRRTA